MKLKKILAILINIAGCILTVTGGAFSEMKLSAFGLLMGVLAGLAPASRVMNIKPVEAMRDE